MIVVDSSFWIEYFLGSELGRIIKENNDFKNNRFYVPTIVIYEVYKKLLHEFNMDLASDYISNLQTGIVINLDMNLSIASARLGKENKLPLADSIIYATAQKFNADLYTMDQHFKDLPGVKYFEKEAG